MKDVTISPTMQLVAGLVVVGGIAVVAIAELPELRRYLSIRGM